MMLASTAAAWAAWLIVLFRVDPFASGPVGFLLFYLSLWLSLTGTISLLGLMIRAKIKKEEAIFRQVSNSFRQATFLGALIVGLLYFQGHRLLTWWNLILFVIGLMFLEFFWLSYSSVRRR